ncbi:MAG: hypothetical protein LBO02_03490 [Holosporaceae bacterium]|nr:hypothetical protein [Holosporaceae bacterium]
MNSDEKKENDVNSQGPTAEETTVKKFSFGGKQDEKSNAMSTKKTISKTLNFNEGQDEKFGFRPFKSALTKIVTIMQHGGGGGL